MRLAQYLLIGMVSIVSLAGCRSRHQHQLEAQDRFMLTEEALPGQTGHAVVGDADLPSNRNIAGGLPRSLSHFLGVDDDRVYLSRHQFVVSFNVKAKVPLWTAWQVVRTDLGDVSRSDNFRGDDILNNYLESKKQIRGISPDDYVNSCFDRGHQAPSADRTSRYDDNLATFYMSNMAPQTAFLNRRIWADLESFSRDLVRKEGRKLQIYAGTILRDGREKIGRNKDIDVPESYYKVVAIYANDLEKKPMAHIAVMMPNVTSRGKDPLAYLKETCQEQKTSGSAATISKSWKDYRVSLKQIEQTAGVKFPHLERTEAL